MKDTNDWRDNAEDMYDQESYILPEARFGLVSTFEGDLLVEARQAQRHVFFPAAILATTSALAIMAGGGIIVLSEHALKGIRHEVVQCTSFGNVKVAGHHGWNESVFARADGTVISAPTKFARKRAAFDGIPGSCPCAGDLETWKRDVALPLTGNHLLIFCIMKMLEAPMLIFTDRCTNVGLEICGPAGSGKTTALRIASSIAGSPNRTDYGRYVMTLQHALHCLDDTLLTHADMPIVIDGVNAHFAGETEAKQAAAYKQLLFGLGSGVIQKEVNGRRVPPVRTSYLIESREPLAEIVGEDSALAMAATDELITLRVGPDRPLGVFDRLPPEHNSAGAFARALLDAASNNYGVAMGPYLQKLVTTRFAEEPDLRQHVRQLVANFCRLAGIDETDGTAVRHGEMAGTTYAAGMLGQMAGVLPAEWDCAAAALACYRMHRAGAGSSMSFISRLEQLAADPDTIHIGKGQAAVDDEVIDAADVIVQHRKSGRLLFVRPDAIEDEFPDWRETRKLPEVKQLRRRDKDRHTVKKTLKKGGDEEAVICFRLPLEPPEEE